MPGIDRALRCIHERENEPLALEEIERAATTGHSKLTRLFRDRTGMTPIEHLGSVRMKRACALLRNTARSIDSVTQAVGYQNSGAFAERFKRETGQTPTEFRRHGARRL